MDRRKVIDYQGGWCYCSRLFSILSLITHRVQLFVYMLNNAVMSSVFCRISSTWLLRCQDGQMQKWRYECQIICSQNYST